jgi:Zn finger protein HypA/HybF involved in hydrogenase expression
MKCKYTEEELKNAIKSSLSIAQVCRLLGIRPVGGNYKSLKKKIKTLDLDITHFTGAGWNVGLRYKPFGKRILLEEILVENSSYSNTSSLRLRLIKEGLKKHKCERCLNTEWLGQPIKLELNHMNGVNDDNRIDNLEIICPNCHSITENYRGRNKLSALSEKKGVEYRKFRESLTANPEPSLKKIKEGAETLHGISKSIKFKICLGCKEEFKPSDETRKYCSKFCYQDDNRKRIPKVPELLEAFDVYKSFTKVGEHYNVSDNSVRKWCEAYGIIDMIKRKSRPQTY